MKNRLNVIKINGFSGMFIAALLIGCVIEGVIIFPSKMLMHLWNYIALFINNMPTMTLIHGVILWAIIALSTYAILREKSPISYHSPNVISDEDIREIIEQAKQMEKVTPVIKEEKSEQEIKH